MENGQVKRKEIFAPINVEFENLNEKKTVKALLYNISTGDVNFKINNLVKEGEKCKINIGHGNHSFTIDGYINAIQNMDGNRDVYKTAVQFNESIDKDKFFEIVNYLDSIGFN